MSQSESAQDLKETQSKMDKLTIRILKLPVTLKKLHSSNTKF